jgi:signal transduction histidine kinase
MMRRLFLQIYLTMIAALVIFAIAAVGAWRLGNGPEHVEETFALAGELASHVLPEADAPRAEQQRALDVLRQRVRGEFTLYGPDGSLLATTGPTVPPPHMRFSGPPWQPGPGGPTLRMRIPDGRVLVVHAGHPPLRPGQWLVISLVLIAVAVAAGAYPAARRLTRRLERLQTGVENLGRGDLAARVQVEGSDEIAALAGSFNRSAARIEELVTANKMLLANCSHELRTPLARIGMALALLGDNVDGRKREQIKADIAELDQLIDDILMASRLDTGGGSEHTERIDLLALAAEEAAREGIGVEGEPVAVCGERPYLRRLVRNLLDNARRHAADQAPEVRVTRTSDGMAQLDVRDHGPGVADAEREKIFAPFYRVVGSAERGRGSGLGLALVREIARRHGGDVACLPGDGGGSLFRVRLPAVS